ncbi:ECF transporter S component [Sporohalobacter salinus]|uniref:ECF transporter S component n=1 Tax=Sporohalobacter salinus TaxID=1494606 RepID=UPI00196177A1|nr:ECF transporter S component [Sporohalobacter salinus]MBM7624394.1 putative membrane protein [Sporohalobacter salinus]
MSFKTEINSRTKKDNFWQASNLVKMALFIALSGIGAWFPFPSPIGTVALDAAPGYFLSLMAGGWQGAIVLCLGHLISAFKMGFPLGPIHILIGFLMGGCGLVVSYLHQRFNRVIIIVVGALLNGVGVTGLLIPLVGMGFFVGMTPVLLLASVVNITLAVLLYRLLKEKVDQI